MTEILFGERSPVAVRMEAPGDGDKHHHQQCVNLPIEHKATAVITQQAGNVRRRTRQQEADTLHKCHQSGVQPWGVDGTGMWVVCGEEGILAPCWAKREPMPEYLSSSWP